MFRKIREGCIMAKKKKPVETIDVVEIQEPVIEEISVMDEVEVDIADDVAEPDVIDREVIADEVEATTEELPEKSPKSGVLPLIFGGVVAAIIGLSAARSNVVETTTEELPEKPPKSGVLPLIFGGVVAAIIGFSAARSNVVDNFLPPSWRMNAGEVALQDQITSAQSQIDSLNEKLLAVSSGLADMPTPDDSLNAQISELTERMSAVEKRPIAASTSSSDVSGDFAALRATAEQQQAEIDALLADARIEKQTANDAASSTLARAAATRIVTAIESGAPFAGAVSDLEATGTNDIPEVLRNVATDGVITLAKLQNGFPDASRAALAASPVDTAGGLGGFLKRQLGARSVAPREGTDPDAILSRVEGAVREGRLTDALAEVETLPQDSKSAMSGWIETAKTRLAVTSASQALMQRLVAN
jgi:hypothetical protein